MVKRMQRCFNCGEELGVYDNFGELDHCGKPDCSREFRYMIECERADRRAAAEDDDFNRY